MSKNVDLNKKNYAEVDGKPAGDASAGHAHTRTQRRTGRKHHSSTGWAHTAA